MSSICPRGNDSYGVYCVEFMHCYVYTTHIFWHIREKTIKANGIGGRL